MFLRQIPDSSSTLISAPLRPGETRQQATSRTLPPAGVFVGSNIASRLPVARLRLGFAIMVIFTGTFVLWQS